MLVSFERHFALPPAFPGDNLARGDCEKDGRKRNQKEKNKKSFGPLHDHLVFSFLTASGNLIAVRLLAGSQKSTSIMISLIYGMFISDLV